MRCPSVLPDEPERLKALAQYGLSSTRPLPSLDPVVEIATKVFDTPTAAVNLVGQEEVYFAASCGAADCDMARDISFCAHAIVQEEVMVVEDARLDPRFYDNPLVTGPAQIRFYAGVPLRSPDGHALGALCIIDTKPRSSFSSEQRGRLKDLARLVSDRLELRRLEVAGKQGLRRFERMAHATPNGILCVDVSGAVAAANPAAAQMFGYTEDQLVGQQLEAFIPAWKASKIASRLPQGSTKVDAWAVIEEDIHGCRADGEDFPVEVAWTAWMEDDQPNLGLVIRDLRSQRRQQDELYHLANFDRVTALPNLNYFREQLAQERIAAVLIISLNQYQELSGSLGSKYEEEILQLVAERLRHGVRTVDTIAHIGSGEFGICLAGIGDPLRAREAADTAIAAIAQPINMDGSEVRVRAHCGIALRPSHGSDAGDLIGNAHLALQEARKPGKAETFLFAPALRMQAVARRMFDAELHQAVERNELELYYQPQVRLSDGVLTGAEALLRWNHPARGILAPAAFLPALENSPLVEEVGRWIIDTACRNAAQWRVELSPHFRMSINLFAAQFFRGSLRAVVNEATAQYCLPNAAIELEITETTALNDEAVILPLLRGLSEDGIQLAFDDFGTGFASLSLLARYPLTHIKIDKGFIQKALVSERDKAIVQAITDLAHRLQLEVIAEGIESRPVFDFCREIGCDEAQGFLIGKPLAAAEFGTAWQQWSGQFARQA